MTLLFTILVTFFAGMGAGSNGWRDCREDDIPESLYDRRDDCEGQF